MAHLTTFSKAIITVILLTCMILPKQLKPQCSPCGYNQSSTTLNANTTWSHDKNINQNYIVPAGVTLTIGSGVTINFDLHQRITVLKEGKMVIEENATLKLCDNCRNNGSDDWDGIRVHGEPNVRHKDPKTGALNLNDHGYLKVKKGVTFKDGRPAVFSRSGGILDIWRANFVDNIISVFIQGYIFNDGNPSTPVKRDNGCNHFKIEECHFEWTEDRYNEFANLNNINYPKFIRLDNVASVQIGGNTFINNHVPYKYDKIKRGCGISGYNALVSVTKSQFNGFDENNCPKFGIEEKGGSPQINEFKNLSYGIKINNADRPNFSVGVANAKFTNNYKAIYIRGGKDHLVEESSMTKVKDAMTSQLFEPDPLIAKFVEIRDAKAIVVKDNTTSSDYYKKEEEELQYTTYHYHLHSLNGNKMITNQFINNYVNTFNGPPYGLGIGLYLSGANKQINPKCNTFNNLNVSILIQDPISPNQIPLKQKKGAADNKFKTSCAYGFHIRNPQNPDVDYYYNDYNADRPGGGTFWNPKSPRDWSICPDLNCENRPEHKCLANPTNRFGHNKQAHAFKIYPNPASNAATVRIPQKLTETSKYRLKVLNLQGKLVKSIHLANKVKSINLSNLNTGLYFVKMVNKEQGTLATRKLVIN